MIFSVQRFVEDYLAKRGLEASDDYPSCVASLFVGRGDSDLPATLRKLRRIRTSPYRNAPSTKRADFEESLIESLFRQFGKTPWQAAEPEFSALAKRERRSFVERTTPRKILERFAASVEARAVDAFWIARTQLKLKPQPESIAQGLLGVFAKAALNGKGVALREGMSGTGFVDLAIVLRGGVAHLVELKIHSAGKLKGPTQLATYMKHEGRREGWLLVFDARPSTGTIPRDVLPSALTLPSGKVHVMVVDINPIKPSARR